ncbi:hypothetical protein ACM66B_006131 [Microbotryomycetes sp. NB124-2]
MSLVCWICTVRGWVVLMSAFMTVEYFGIAWVLRRIVWKVVAGLYENIVSYNIFKGLLSEWIPVIKRDFYVCLGYSAVGVFGFLGALFNAQLFLWVYAIYLLGSWIVNAMEIIKVTGKIVDLEEKVNEACNFVGKLFDADCDGFFDKVQTYTIAGCAVVLVRRNYLKTGYMFTTWFASAKQVEHRAREMEEKKEHHEQKKRQKHDAKHEKHHEKHRHALAPRRPRESGNGQVDEKSLLSRYASSASDDSESGEDDEWDSQLPLPPSGRRRRGVNPGRRIRYTKRDQFWV